ncbi:MAG: 8-oxo-dGTP diphosphatase [Clostridia bacterium]|nr:8-oxo-dGTP diphosphatase [Clostridia bacterium]
MENVILTNMCMVYDESGNVLVQKRKDTDRWPGIAFPGGHVEAGESFTAAVIREVFEETGIKIKHPKLCGTKQWQTERNGVMARYIVMLYKTNEFEGEVKSSNEGEAFWVNRKDLDNMKLANTFEHMLKIFEDDSLEELFSYKENGIWQFEFLG